MVGELLRLPGCGGVTGLDLSWNGDVGCDGAAALATALRSAGAAPLRWLDLAGTRVCDLDETGGPVPKFQAAYAGSARAEPVTVPSRFRSGGVVELGLLLRSGAGAGPTLRRLVLSDNCLCPPFEGTPAHAAGDPRPTEWCRPPDCFDRACLRENTPVRVLINMPGAGLTRLRREWHEGTVGDIKASLVRGTFDVGVTFSDEAMMTKVRPEKVNEEPSEGG